MITARRKQADESFAVITASATPAGNWRQTDLGWRRSLRSLPMPFGFRGYSLTRSQRRDLGLSLSQLAVRVVTVQTKGLAGNLGLRKRDTIVSLGGAAAKRTLEQLKSDIVRRYKPGDAVPLKVLRNGKTIPLKGILPNWHTDETTVP